MKRRLAALLAALALVVASLGATAAPALADEARTIKIDVNAENGDYDGYKVDDDAITLLEPEVIYELSGEEDTERQVLVTNSGAADGQFFYLLLNGVMVQGGIAAQDQDTFNLCLNVPDDTTSSVEAINAHNLWILGGGTLCAESLNVGASSVNAATASESYLSVVDTQIEVRRDASATGPCVWMGFAELSGNASVTYVSAGDYAALRVLNVGRFDEAVTIKDDARLYCLQADADAPSDTYVDGLQVVRGKLLLQDNAFLQAEARPLADPIADVAEAQGGCAVFCGNDIEVRDNAQMKAKAYGWAINTGSNVSVSGEGAYVQATSKNAQGIYLEGGLSVSDGARVDATGKLEGVYSLGTLSVDNATLTSESETLNAVKSAANININGSVVATTSAPGFAAFSADGETVIEGSLVVVEKGAGLDADVIDSIVFVGGEGMVVGNAALLDDLAIDSGETLTISAGDSLTIPADKHLYIAEGGTLVNNGTVHVMGTIDNEGTVECNSHSGGTATCSKRAVCDLCHAEYGELDPANHAGLEHVEAKAATTTAEGNIEYWCCPDCQKCFSDEAGTAEISKASTVTPRLAEERKPEGQKPAADKKPAAKKVPKTGDPLTALPVAVALIGGCALLAVARESRQR